MHHGNLKIQPGEVAKEPPQTTNRQIQRANRKKNSGALISTHRQPASDRCSAPSWSVPSHDWGAIVWLALTMA
jgi:hypothetical protein